jgi:hypothetical protein
MPQQRAAAQGGSAPQAQEEEKDRLQSCIFLFPRYRLNVAATVGKFFALCAQSFSNIL